MQKNIYAGKFIVFEGIDGAGKSLQGPTAGRPRYHRAKRNPGIKKPLEFSWKRA